MIRTTDNFATDKISHELENNSILLL